LTLFEYLRSDHLENRVIPSRLRSIHSLHHHPKHMVTMYNHSPMNQQSMPQGYEPGGGPYPQPTPYGGIGFGLGGGGNDMGAGGHGRGQMSMLGGQMGGMGMGGGRGMMSGGFMGPGGMAGMGSMSRGMALGNPQQTSHLMAGMSAGGMGAMGPMNAMGMGMGAMGQSGFVETSIEPLVTSYPFTPNTSVHRHLNPVHSDLWITLRYLISRFPPTNESLTFPYPFLVFSLRGCR